ncbi:ribonuclease domain-containing protein [Nocardioides sp. S5]|jgi:ribonuclease T1|uniref:ribonuclease domain-containing protein n=1 Tax=Nocardioides sp. S5 TaxID=2017486 RepID=UPI001F5DD174|nr:ribonuclease domain-containing protein [Nocardioides sp. S5]
MPASAARQRYRWVVLLAAAVILLVSMFIPADRDGTDPSAGSGTSDAPSELLPQLDEAVSDAPTTFPSTGSASGLPLVGLSDLPPEAARTVELIETGGPFPEPEHDGGVFGNREELLPDRPRGYYREYTVPTPGSYDRGARRIVAGSPGEYYWTDDHYSSFARVDVDS